MTGEGGSVRRRPASPGRKFVRKSRGAARTVPTARRSPTVRYAIDVRNEQAHLSVPAGRIRRIARLALAAEEVAHATISVALVDNQAIHRLNRQHLNHDYETDVLSFLFDSEPNETSTAAVPTNPRGTGRRIDGEIVISAEMALKSAPRFGWTAAEELSLYLIHGLLHLCGYDDGTDSERRLMQKRERAILNLLEE